MRATAELRQEHEGIQHMLRILKAVGIQFGYGNKLPPGDVAGILDFLATFVDRCHHGKEEDYLVPALEAAGVAREGGPIGVMLAEHEQGRKLVAKLKEGVARYDAGDKTAAVNIQHTIDDYAALLTQHIAKENDVLFPMAVARIDTDKDAELCEAFERLEHERIGAGRHDEFHALLERLQHTYL